VRHFGREVPLLIREWDNTEFRVHKPVAELDRTILLHHDAALLVAGLLYPGSDLLRVRD
jgi:hypothetical protein